ncbi:7311_t:CDS:2, partial [Gigaspora margarita]
DRKSKKLKIKENIYKFVDSLSQQELIEVRNYIDSITPNRQSVIEKKLDKLIDKIKSLPDQQILRIEHLVNTMVYFKGNMKGEILSQYIQNKANDFVNSGLFKHYSSADAFKDKIKKLETENKKLAKALENSNNKLRSFRMKIKITPSQFNVAAKKIIKQNKKEYSAKFVKLATDISNVGTVSLSAATECTNKMITFFTGETLDKKLSIGTLSRWNREVSTISLEQNRPRTSQLLSYSYGVMADESTRGDKKVFLVCFLHWSEQYNKPMATLAKMVDLNRCNGAIVAKTVKETCEENKLDPRQCGFWLTDNTAYMSGKNDKSKCLPPGYRAHELPDQVSFWLSELQRAVINPYIIFEKELTEARSTLCDQEFTTLTHQIKLGLQKARDGFLKWMGCWTHLPLTICLLGGNNGPDFARSICRVFLNRSLNDEITDKELLYTELLKKDKLEGNFQSFEARLLLSSPNRPEVRLDREDLLAIRKEKRSNIVNKAEIELGETAAKVILDELLKKKKVKCKIKESTNKKIFSK